MTESCSECGFSWACSGDEVVAALRSFPRRFGAPLSRFLGGEDGGALLRARPEPAVWSAIEYAAHTRDGIGFYADRIRRVLDEDQPQLEPFDADALCEERRYRDEDPEAVSAGLAEVTTRLADLLEGLDDAQWERDGIGIDGGDRTVLTLARRAAHEGHHHLLDVGRALRHAREQL